MISKEFTIKARATRLQWRRQPQRQTTENSNPRGQPRPVILCAADFGEDVYEDSRDGRDHDSPQVGVEPLEAVLSLMLLQDGHGCPVEQREAGGWEEE